MDRVVTLTLNSALDVAASVGSVAAEIKLRCDAPRYHPGGGGINVSRAMRFLGGESCAVYAAGGHTGAMLTNLLAAEGIDQRALPSAGLTRESFVVYERSTGLQYRFTLPGPEMRESEWLACRDAVFDFHPDIIVFSGSLPAGIGARVFGEMARLTRESGARLIVDSSDLDLSHLVDTGVYLLKPNLRELRRMAGAELAGEEEIRAAALALIQRGVAEAVAVSLGAAGAALVTGGEYAFLRAPVVPIRSKVGAGDSMVAGMALRLAHGGSLLEAARFGVAAGSAAVMTPGTMLCRGEDANRLYREVAVSSGGGTDAKREETSW